MIDIHISEGPFFIGTVANCPRILVASIGLANVPAHVDLATGGFADPWIVPFPAITYPEQYAFNRLFLPLVANHTGE
jgi:peptide/nickel transport system substrate-binding protein